MKRVVLTLYHYHFAEVIVGFNAGGKVLWEQSSFYNAVSRLRRNACAIPDPVNTTPIMDLTSNKQDVVQIDIRPDRFPEKPVAAVSTGAVGELQRMILRSKTDAMRSERTNL